MEKTIFLIVYIGKWTIHCVVHIIHCLTPIEPQRMSGIVLGFVDLNENPIDEFNTTLKFEDVHTKGSLLFSKRPSNFITYGLTSA